MRRGWTLLGLVVVLAVACGDSQSESADPPARGLARAIEGRDAHLLATELGGDVSDPQVLAAVEVLVGRLPAGTSVTTAPVVPGVRGEELITVRVTVPGGSSRTVSFVRIPGADGDLLLPAEGTQ